tara:strand:+ start:5634 stop:7394 length:1761 start_codon:yes stop_codon:yes gene_type:complete
LKELNNENAFFNAEELITNAPSQDLDSCLKCDFNLKESELYDTYKVCSSCDFHFYIKPYDRLDLLTDRESFVEFNQELTNVHEYLQDELPEYKKRTKSDVERTGLNDAVITGIGTMGGNNCVIILMDFSFMGGNLGLISGEKISLAIDEAVSKKIPIVSIISSSGTRIEEGILSLMQMAKVTLSMANAKSNNIPSLSLLTNPCTGQAYITLATYSDIILSEPGASVGMSPLKDLKGDYGSVDFESRASDSMLKRGLIDSIVNRNQHKEQISRIIDLLNNNHKLVYENKESNKPNFSLSNLSIEERVKISLSDKRPSSSIFLKKVFENFFEIKGDRLLDNSDRIITGLAQLGSQTVMVVAQENTNDNNSIDGLKSSDFRKCTRAINLASRFKIPLITFIDTVGHNITYNEEIKGIGTSLGETMLSMAQMSSPSISVLISRGGSEAALSLDISDRRLMLENAILVMGDNRDYKDSLNKPSIIGAKECKDLKIVDSVIPEPVGGIHMNPDECFSLLRKFLMIELAMLNKKSERSRFKDKYKKFRNISDFNNSYLYNLANEAIAAKGKITDYISKKISERKSKIRKIKGE